MNIHRAFRPRRNSISGGIIGRCPTQSAERAATRRDPLLFYLSPSPWFHFPLSSRSDLPANFLSLANTIYEKLLHRKIVRTIKLYRKNSTMERNSFARRCISQKYICSLYFERMIVHFFFTFLLYYFLTLNHLIKIVRLEFLFNPITRFSQYYLINNNVFKRQLNQSR